MQSLLHPPTCVSPRIVWGFMKYRVEQSWCAHRSGTSETLRPFLLIAFHHCRLVPQSLRRLLLHRSMEAHKSRNRGIQTTFPPPFLARTPRPHLHHRHLNPSSMITPDDFHGRTPTPGAASSPTNLATDLLSSSSLDRKRFCDANSSVKDARARGSIRSPSRSELLSLVLMPSCVCALQIADCVCHLRKHHRQHIRPISCLEETCASSHAQRRDMHRHMWNSHPGLAFALDIPCPGARCSECGGRFGRKDAVTKHRRSGACKPVRGVFRKV